MADMKTVTINGVTYKIEDPDALSGTDTTLTQANKAADAAAVGTALAGKAPTGFGLGGAAKPITDLNAALNCGWYCWGSNAANVPFPYGTALVLSRYGTDRVQLAFDTALGDGGYYGAIARRIYYNSSWQPWEFVNPPMALGVEYRTTERWNGEGVYTKQMHLGQAADATNIDISGFGINRVLRYSGCIGRYALPQINAKNLNDNWSAYLSASNTEIIVRCGSSLVGNEVYCTIWYTKN